MNSFWKRKSVILVLSLVLAGLFICIAVRSSGKIRFSGRREWKAYTILFGLALMVFPPICWLLSDQLNRFIVQPIASRTKSLSHFLSSWVVPTFKKRPWLALIPLPFLLYAINPNLTFANDHHCDAWIYHGLFYSFDLHMTMIPGRYFASRLPAVVPGYLLYSAFPFAIAHFAYHLLFYYLGLFSVYSILSKLRDRATGFLIALLFGTHTMILGIASTDYVSFPTLVFFTMFMAFFLKACTARKTGFLYLVASGCFAGCAFWNNLSTIIFLPFFLLLGIWYYFRARHTEDRFAVPLLKICAWLFAGFLICTAICSLCNVAIANGSIFFFMSQVNYARSHDGALWIAQNFNYLYFAPYIWPMGLALGMLGACLFACFSSGWKSLIEKFPQVLFVTQLLGIAIFEVFYSKSMFQCDYYVCYIIPSMLIAFGCLFSFENFRATKIEVASLGCWLALLALVIALPLGNALYKAVRSVGMVLPFLLTLAAVVLAANWKFRASFVPLVFLGISQLGLFPPQYGLDPWLAFHASRGRTLYNQVDQGVRFILKEGWNTRSVYWVNEEEGSIEILGIRRSMLDSEYANRKFPALPDKPFEPGQQVVMMSKHLDVIERARHALRQQGLDLANPHSTIIGDAPQDIELVCATIVKIEEPSATDANVAYFLSWNAASEAFHISRGTIQEIAANADQAKFVLSDGAAVECGSNRIRITTVPARGTGQVTTKLMVEESGDYRLRVHVHLAEGAFQMELVHPTKGSLGHTWTPENGETRTVIEYQMYLKKGQVYTLAFGNIVRRNASTFDVERFDISKL
ncbi:MAG: hypothetical protein KIS92_15855 [Planctomycetota bacterium]|nr:hypothetical protein [Planctomycetota bacterium]